MRSANPVFDVCAECNATAIANPEHARHAKVTLSPDNVQPPRQRPSIPEGYLLPSSSDDAVPSILREYHYSLPRICIYTLLGVAALIVCIAFLFLLS